MSHASLPYSFAKAHGILISRIDPDGAQILLREDATLSTLTELRRTVAVPLKLHPLSRGEFEAALAEHYSQNDGSAAEVVADVGQEIDLSQLIQELPAVEDLLETQDDAPIIRMINALLTQAVRDSASDIHIEPYERHSSVRFRRDGVLHEVVRPHRGLHAAMVSRLKIMASLDIAEKRLPQDGRITIRLAGRAVDVRVSTLPTNHGERLVLRLLDKGSGTFDLHSMGMSNKVRDTFQTLLQQPHGIILVTGPTGSGKSTTLYAALQSLDSNELNIVTVEDPVEYDLPGVGQVAVNAKIELSFARALRSILRQDPDVIMIGEIRDLETAQIAVQASLTGHLVLATLHTNSASAAITRLIDMGVEPFLLASTVRGVLAQRLVRCLCPVCRMPGPGLDDQTRERLDTAADHPTFYQANGCSACGQTGYRGRTGIYELMTLNDALAKLIHDGVDEHQLRQHAVHHGLTSLRQDGIRHLISGTTSVAELLRATGD